MLGDFKILVVSFFISHFFMIPHVWMTNPLQNTCRLPAFIFASFRRFFRRNNSTAFLQIADKKSGKVAHRRFYKSRRVPTNAETRDAENNIIFRHTGVSRNAGMSIILIIDIPAFWWNAGMLLFNINFFGVCRNAEKCLKIIKKNNFRPNLTLNWDENLVL